MTGLGHRGDHRISAHIDLLRHQHREKGGQGAFDPKQQSIGSKI